MRKLSSPSSSFFLSLLLVFFLAASHFLAAQSRIHACDPGNKLTETFSFCDASKTKYERATDLVNRLSLTEKIAFLSNNAPAMPNLGLSSYEWWSEALHGVSNVGPGTKFGSVVPGATIFPQVILTAASFNNSLFHAIGKVVSTEARAMYNLGQAGLTFWSPNINIFRDPRWGRGQETPGEDPYLTSNYAIYYVRGLQGRTSRDHLKIAACCKHFTAYDLDNWNGVDRFHFNAIVSKRDMEETYNLPFEACVSKGRSASVMCSYNMVNGIPTCADANLLTNTVRNQWRLDGYIVSDCDSVDVLYSTDHYVPSPEMAAAITLQAGLDLNCGKFLAVHGEEAVLSGQLNVSDVDRALKNTFMVQIMLGMFDGDSSKRQYGKLSNKNICTKQNQQLALEAARQGIVLLKNENSALPLHPDVNGIVAVIGPNSNATLTMIGNYAGIPCRYTSPLEGIGSYAKVAHHTGCDGVLCPGNETFEDAEKLSRNSVATILVMGLDQLIEREQLDRTSLLLPGMQEELVNRVSNAAGGPVILVIMSGGPVDISFAKYNPNVSAILWAGYPGQNGGMAIADNIFGLCNPSGKLPMTWYPESYVQNLSMTDMKMRQDPATGFPGRTYRFYRGKVVYPFGHGLSYSQFRHNLVEAPSSLSLPLSTFLTGSGDVLVSEIKCTALSANFHVDVMNIGKVDGAETVMIFQKWEESLKLVEFKKVTVPAGALASVAMKVDVCNSLSFVDEEGFRRVRIGMYNLLVGDLRHSLLLTTKDSKP